MTKIADLGLLAEEIRQLHAASGQSLTSPLHHARRAGELLLELKAAVPHDGWPQWLAEHCPTLSTRTAQACMRVASQGPADGAGTPRGEHSHRDPEIDWDARFELHFALSDDLQAEHDELAARPAPTTTDGWAELAAASLKLATRRQELNVAMIQDFGQFVRALSAQSGVRLPRKWSMFDDSLQPFFEKLRPLEDREDMIPKK